MPRAGLRFDAATSGELYRFIMLDGKIPHCAFMRAAQYQVSGEHMGVGPCVGSRETEASPRTLKVRLSLNGGDSALLSPTSARLGIVMLVALGFGLAARLLFGRAPVVDALAFAPGSMAMNLPSALFCGLVLVTAGVSYRWGSMVGLIFFVFTLTIGAAAATRWAVVWTSPGQQELATPVDRRSLL